MLRRNGRKHHDKILWLHDKQDTVISAIRKGAPVAESDIPHTKNDELWQHRKLTLLSPLAVFK